MRPLSRLLVDPRVAATPVAFGREGAVTWSDLLRDVGALRLALAPQAGARIALHAQDAYAFAVGLLAIAQVEATAVLPPSRQPGALEALAHETALFLLDGEVPEAIGGRPCRSPLAAAPAGAPDFVALEREAPWVELFTSGTTGDHKPIAKAIRHLEDEVDGLEDTLGARLGPDCRVLATAAPQHLYGLLFRVLWPLAAGRPFLRTPVLHPEEIAATLPGGDFALAGTPVALRRLVERPDLAAHATHCRAVFSSGGPLETDVAQRFSAVWGAPPVEVYGSTETGGIAMREQRRGDEPWRPFPGVELTIDDDDGRLVVTSPFVSGGEPVAPARERLATGDRAEATAGGGFQLRGRADRVVKVAEKRLSLPDMEARLAAHPSVAEAALVLVDGAAEPRVAAVVVPSESGREALAALGRRALARPLTEHLARDFDRVLLPRVWRVVDALPRDAQGKTSARALRALAQDAPRDEQVDPPRAPERLHEERTDDGIVVEWQVPHDLAQLEGHFPGRPVVAGVVQLDWVMELIGELLGSTPRLAELEALKFHEVLQPGDRVRVEVSLEAGRRRFRFRLTDAERPARIFASARGRLHDAP